MAPSAVVVIVDGSTEIVLGRVEWPRCDLGVVDALARTQLEARRVGRSIQLREISDDLRELLRLAGLLRELGGEAEGSEEIGIEEVVDRRDPAV